MLLHIKTAAFLLATITYAPWPAAGLPPPYLCDFRPSVLGYRLRDVKFRRLVEAR